MKNEYLLLVGFAALVGGVWWSSGIAAAAITFGIFAIIGAILAEIGKGAAKDQGSIEPK